MADVMVGGGFTQSVKIAGMASAFNIGMERGGAGPLQDMHCTRPSPTAATASGVCPGC